MKFVIFGFAILLSACSSTYKDFKSANVKPNEGVAVGRVHVLYNDKPFNKNCAVCMNSVNGPCQTLTEEGFVFINLPMGEASLRRIACKDVSPQHYNISDASF